MTVERFVRKLHEMDVQLAVVNGKLKVSAPAGVLDSAMLARLREHKQDIIDLLVAAHGTPSPAPIPLVPRSGLMPCSLAQQRLWLVRQISGNSAAYNLPSALRLSGTLDVEAMRSSLAAIVHRHEALRTVFVDIEGEPMQRIVDIDDAGKRFNLPLIHAMPDDLVELADAHATQHFDLEQGPLLDVVLLRLAADEHVLLLNLHHIVADGWSMGVLVHELRELYAARLAGREPSLAALALQYADYAAWQHQSQDDGARAERDAYWREHLAGIPDLLRLPTDRPRPAVLSERGGTVDLQLPATCVESARRLARKERSSLFMLLLTVFQLQLSRICGERDIVVGSPIANRPLPELEVLIGFFVNTLVLRTQVTEERSFRGLLQGVRDCALQAFAHQDMPFEQLVEMLKPTRSLSHSSLFQVMFTLQNASEDDLALPGLRLRPLHREGSHAKFDLMLGLEESPQGVVGRFTYATDLFDASTIQRWAQDYLRLVAAVLAAPDMPLRLLASDDASATVRRLAVGIGETLPLPGDASVPAMLATHASSRPDADAVTGDGRRLTFGELDHQASLLARALRGRSVGRESRVGVCLPRSPSMVVAMLAVWKAGAAWVPLDPSYPLDRLRHICADAEVACVIGAGATGEICAALGCPTIDIDLPNIGIGLPDVAPAATHPQQLAYLIYTSGSTGTPKGVMVGHGALSNLVAWYARQTGICADDRGSQIAQFGFDASVREIWGALAAGASVHIVDAETRLHPQRLLAWLHDCAITVGYMPTALAEEVLSAGYAMPPSLRWLGCGGDRLKHHPPAQPGFGLLNFYGPTEAAVVALAGVVPSDRTATITIGRPLPNTRAYVLDAALHPVAEGQPGELHLAGANLGRGYYGRADLTAERFLPDPHAAEPGARMYRTGDRVRWLPGGEIEFLGRIDNQVKLRGFRIELGEIESVLARQPGVGNAAVVLRDSPSGAAALVGYVSPADGHRLEEASLRDGLAQHLPSYMIPSLLQVLTRLPLAPGGKVARDALPAPVWGDGAEAQAPRNDTEQLLADEWRDLLGAGQIGINDDFFALGGHSLLATRMLARINARFALQLPLTALFNGPTIVQLARHIDSQAVGAASHARSAGSTVPTIACVPRDRPLPLSFAQQRLWFLAQLDPDSNAYHVPAVVRLRGRLDVAALTAAIGSLVERHEGLRARIVEIDGEPRQYLDQEVEPLRLVAVSEHELQDELQRLIATPFDLARDPMLRSRLLHLGEDDHVLALVVHHIVADGWSMNLLSRDLAELYAAQLSGNPPDLPALPIQYADYAHWQRHHLDEVAQARELAYWTDKLAGVPEMLDLPLDRPRSPTAATASALESMHLDPVLVAQLREIGQRHRATLFMTLLAALKILLYRLSGQGDICIGTPMANRSRLELEPVVGLFLGILALRTRLDDAPSFEQCLQRVRETALEAYTHQDLPFERIVDALKLERNLSRHPLFQVFFNMLNLEDVGAPRLPGLEATALTPPDQGSKFDFTLYAHERGDSLGLQVHYNAEIFGRQRMAELLRQYQWLLQQVVADPALSIDRYSLRTAYATACLPDPRMPLDDDWQGSIPEWFERQCLARPEHPAASDACRTFSYRELDVASNRLAHRLIAGGIGPGDVIALHTGRCAMLAVALMGVLKTGAAFMILDAAYPDGRLLACVDAVSPAAWLRIGAVPSQSPEVHARLASVPLQLALDDALTALEGWSDMAPPDPRIGPDSLSHIAFTSGSTGRPKVIAGRHGPFTHFLPWFQQRFGIGSEDRYSVLSGLSHDPMQRDVLWPLMFGGTACFPDPEQMVPGSLAHWMHAQRISVANLTPAMARLLCDVQPGMALPDLRQAFVVGDVLNRGDVRQLAALAPGCAVVSLYGATETQWALGFEAADPGDASPVVALGSGFPDVQLLLLNRVGEPAGIGEPAEICIRSPHIAQGYWQEQSLSDTRFVVNPFTADSRDRVYRTGDLGRYLPDGRVRGFGRSDRQVSIRGFRVELGEIEAVLARHPGVSHAAVVAIQSGIRSGNGNADSTSIESLAAFVVARTGHRCAPEQLVAELRRNLRQVLPEYMLPARLECLATMPLNANGKVDHVRLLDLVPAITPSTQCDTAPATDSERKVERIIAAVLGREQIGCTDNFFDLGGNSLSAMQVVSRLRSAFGWMVPVRHVFEYPTVAALAAIMDASTAASSDAPIRPLPPGSQPPLSFAQQRLWFLQQLDEGSSAYHMLLALRLHGTLDRAALAAALDALVVRHQSLRTLFVDRDGQARQLILPETTGMALEHVACSEGDLAEAVDRFAARPFALDREPALRACCFRLATDDHALAISLHHIVTDGWSMGLLADELAELYGARHEGRAAELPALPLQYPDYAAWQREQLQGAELERQRHFWREHLQGLPPLLELPTDRPRPAQQSHRGGKVPMRIDGDLLSRLRGLCRDEGVTAFMLLMAVWQLMLSRYAGHDDIAVGFPIANRSRPELEALIGLFANTLVLRTQPRAGLPFRDYLRDVRERTLAVYANQDLPFEAMVEMLQLQRSLAHTPLFQVMFNLQSPSGTRRSLPGLEARSLPRGQEGARFDLTLVLCEGEDAWFGDLEYCSDLFDRGSAERFAAHYLALLQSIADAPGEYLGSLTMLTVDERKRVGNALATQAHPPAMPVHRSFEQWVRRQPNAPALVFGGQTLDYATLDARANRLAHWLRGRGVGVDQLVGLMLPRCVDGAVAVLAVLKAGAAFLPMDPDSPIERVRHILDDAAPSLLLIHETLRSRLPAEADAICLRQLQALEDFRQIADTDPAVPISPEQLAYAIYTSGTTGQPKAAMLTHGGWGNLAAAQAGMHSPRPGSRVLQVVSSAFDVAAGDLALALAHGAALVSAPDEARRAPDQLIDLLQAQRITHVQLPVALLANLPTDALPHLEVVVGGGEAMPSQVIERWAGKVALYNAYGPTETTVMATCARLEQGDCVHIGHAIAGTRAYVLDDMLQPAATHLYGEIWIAGRGVGRGYIGRAAMTAAVFLPDPFADEPGQRMYRSGDIGRWRANGRLEIRGRADSQVKLRGYRIELGEIEAVLRAHPSVDEAVVLLREDRPGIRRLVAYVVGGAGLDIERLREHARATLMDYMQPSAWAQLPAMPLTANGKIDHRALPMPAEAIDETSDALPRSEPEQALARIWCRLLGRDSVGVHDNFFELGGDSILSIQVVALAAQAGWKLTTKQMFERQTIARLAQAASRIVEIAADQHPVAGDLPLTPIQRWFFDTVLVEPQHWNQGVLLTPSMDITFAAADAAVAALQQHHDALRLRAWHGERGWQQRIAEVGERVPLERVVLDATSPEAFARRLTAGAEQLHAMFTLDGHPLFRATWFESSDGQHRRLWLLAHHLLIDTVSWRIVLEDLQTLLAPPAAAASPAGVLPRRTSSYIDWAKQLQAHADSGHVKAQLGYWRDVLTLPMSLPGSSDATADVDVDAAKVTVALDAADTRRLLQGCHHAYGTGINDLLLAALAIAFRRRMGGDCLHVALEGHGREPLFEDLDVSRTVGWFTVSYPLALRLPPGDDLALLIPAVKAQLAAVPDGGLGYGLLRYLAAGTGLADLAKQAGRAPISFNYLGQFDQTMSGDGRLVLAEEGTGRYRDPRQQRPHPIDVLGLVSDGRLQMDFRYGRHRFEPAVIQGFADAFGDALLELVEHCTADPMADGHAAGIGSRRVDPVFAADAALVAIQPEGERPALFCVHPAGGSVACYRPLALALGRSQPLYGLQAPSLSGGVDPMSSFDAMAVFYISAIRHVQPRGPYRLLGWSQGGTIAYEMARQLRQQDEQVELVALVDTGQSRQMLRRNLVQDECADLLEYLEQAGFAADEAALQGLVPTGRFDRLIAQALAQGVLPEGFDARKVRCILDTQRGISSAAAAYQPSPYPGPVVLLRAQDDHLFGHLGDHLGWAKDLCTHWHCIDVPGDHFSCVTPPHVEALAAQLASLLDAPAPRSDGPLSPATLADTLVDEPA